MKKKEMGAPMPAPPAEPEPIEETIQEIIQESVTETCNDVDPVVGPFTSAALAVFGLTVDQILACNEFPTEWHLVTTAGKKIVVVK